MPQYCVKQPELEARIQRPVLHLTDSQGVEGILNRLPRGRKKEPRYGEWGFHAVTPSTGPDLALDGFTTFNAAPGGVVLQVGDTPLGALSTLLGKHGVVAVAAAFASDVGSFTPLWRTYWRPSVWAVNWLVNKSVVFGELRVNPGATGMLGYNFVATDAAGGTPVFSGAIDESVGVAGQYTALESALVSTGSGSTDLSIYRQSGGAAVNETGKTTFCLLRYIKRADAATRFGDLSIGWGGATFDEMDNAAGQAASTKKFEDAFLDQMLTLLPIEGDAAVGGVSGKVKVMLGQNGYSAGNQAQLLTWVDNTHQRIRASLARVGKGNADVLVEFVCQWDTTANRLTYTTAEQLKYDEMAQVFADYARANSARDSKVAFTPLGAEIRERHGALPNWTSNDGSTGYLAGGGDFTHPNAAGALYFPQVEVDLYLRRASGGAAVSPPSRRAGVVNMSTGRHANEMRVQRK